MKKIIYVNQKGGTGKSTIAYNHAYYLAELGKKVLFIDGDEQANSSSSLIDFADPKIVASSLFGNYAINVAKSEHNIVLLQGDSGLRYVERSNISDEDLVERLKIRLKEISNGFDFAVIDTAGANSRIANALLMVSDFSVLPCKVDPYSINVCKDVLKRIVAIQKSWNKNLVNLGILPNEYDATSPAQVGWLKELIGAFKQFMLGAWVAKRSALREAAGEGIPVWLLQSDETDGKSKVKTSARTAGKEIKAVFKIILNKTGE